MPYITKKRREHLRGVQLFAKPQTPGELNYVITMAVHDYLNGRRSYGLFNEVLGVLECAKLELYRRHVAPYEDEKIQENGDVP